MRHRTLVTDRKGNGCMIETGSQAPDFTVEGEGGKPVGLGDFNGRKLVVYFYPKDDTTGCTKEALDLTALSEEFAAAGTAVLGISKDSVKSHERPEEHTSELQSLMRISYAVFCLKKKLLQITPDNIESVMIVTTLTTN